MVTWSDFGDVEYPRSDRYRAIGKSDLLSKLLARVRRRESRYTTIRRLQWIPHQLKERCKMEHLSNSHCGCGFLSAVKYQLSVCLLDSGLFLPVQYLVSGWLDRYREDPCELDSRNFATKKRHQERSF